MTDSIVVPTLKEVDPIVPDEVDQSVLLGQATRPRAGNEVSQWFRVPDAGVRIMDDRLDQIEQAQGGLSVRFNPVEKVLPKLWLKYGYTRSSGSCRWSCWATTPRSRTTHASAAGQVLL